MLSAMAILFCGCATGPGYGLFRTAAHGNAWINTNTQPPLRIADDDGVCLSLSAKSSLNINIECILEYVRRDATFDQADEQNDRLNPWISFNYSF